MHGYGNGSWMHGSWMFGGDWGMILTWAIPIELVVILV